MRRDDAGPYSLDTLRVLGAPQLFERDAATLKARYVAWFEGESGRTVYPMQVEMLLIEALAYALSLVGEEAQLAAEQHLVAFAQKENLDALGPNRSTQRLPAARALTTLRFSAAATTSNIAIPAGTIVEAEGGVEFQTTTAGIIRPETLHADIPTEAREAGSAANGLAIGAIATLQTPIAGISVTNLTVTDGGADIEGDDAYRLRLANAFDRVSSGGGYGWYRETAMGVTSAIVDCGVVRPAPCYIDLYPLTALGPAGPDVRAAVLAAFETARALENRFGDLVTVKPPVAVSRSPVLTVRARAVSASIQSDAHAAAMALLAEWGQRLAALVSPHDVEARVRALPGVVDAEITGLPFEQLGEDEFLAITSLTISIEYVP